MPSYPIIRRVKKINFKIKSGLIFIVFFQYNTIAVTVYFLNRSLRKLKFLAETNYQEFGGLYLGHYLERACTASINNAADHVDIF